MRECASAQVRACVRACVYVCIAEAGPPSVTLCADESQEDETAVNSKE